MSTLLPILTEAQMGYVQLVYSILSCLLALAIVYRFPRLKFAGPFAFAAIACLLVWPLWSLGLRHLVSYQPDPHFGPLEPPPAARAATPILDWFPPSPNWADPEDVYRYNVAHPKQVAKRAYALAQRCLKPEWYAAFDLRGQTKALDELTPDERHKAEVHSDQHMDMEGMTAAMLTALHHLAERGSYLAKDKDGTPEHPDDWFVEPAPESLQAMTEFIVLWNPLQKTFADNVVYGWEQLHNIVPLLAAPPPPVIERHGAKVTVLKELPQASKYRVETLNGGRYEITARSEEEALQLLEQPALQAKVNAELAAFDLRGAKITTISNRSFKKDAQFSFLVTTWNGQQDTTTANSELEALNIIAERHHITVPEDLRKTATPPEPVLEIIVPPEAPAPKVALLKSFGKTGLYQVTLLSGEVRMVAAANAEEALRMVGGREVTLKSLDGRAK